MFSLSLIRTKFGHSDLIDVILGSGVTLILKVFGAMLSFIVTMLISKSLGVYDYGVYALAFSILMVSSNIARFGLDNAILKYVSAAFTKNDWASIHGLFRTSILWVTLSSSIISLILFLSAHYLSHDVFNVKELELILELIGIAILPMALFNLHISFFQAMGGVVKSAILYGIVIPLLMLIGIFVLTTIEAGSATNMLLLYGFNSLINLLICYFIYHRLTKQYSAGKFSSSLLLSTCIPMFWIIVADLIAVQGPQLILGSYWPPDEVAIFSVSMRISILICFILTSASKVMAPKLAKLHNENKHLALSRLSTITATVMLFVAFILSLIVIIFAEHLLSLFGSSFVVGKQVLQLFTVTQLILVVSGIGKIVLQMTGYERACKNISMTNVLIILIFCFILIPNYSSLGAVMSLLVAAIISTSFTLYFIKKELNFNLIGYQWMIRKRESNS